MGPILVAPARAARRPPGGRGARPRPRSERVQRPEGDELVDEAGRRPRSPEDRRRRRRRHGHPGVLHPARPLPAGAPGTIIRTEKVTGVPGAPATPRCGGSSSTRGRSTAQDIAESGYIVVPGGTAPQGGYPILSWAHGTTGFAGICAPSLFTSQGGRRALPRAGPGATTSKPGSSSPPPTTKASARRASTPICWARAKAEGCSTRPVRRVGCRDCAPRSTVMIYGHSQGGQAALFAGELAPTYAPDLHIAGVVAAAPATGLSTILGVATTSVGQAILEFTIPVAYTWARTYHDLPASDMFTPSGESRGRVARAPRDAWPRSPRPSGLAAHLGLHLGLPTRRGHQPGGGGPRQDERPGPDQDARPDAHRPGHGRHHRAARAHRRLRRRRWRVPSGTRSTISTSPAPPTGRS